MNDAAVLKAHGVQPFAVDGKDGWPITRLISAYVMRYYGPNAMEEVASGKLKLTDPGFVQAASIVQQMGEKGYFGPGVSSVDYNTALDEFLSGKAAMYYMGSWELRDFNNPSVDKIGIQNIGLFNVPFVPGGKGNDQDIWMMNTGIFNGFSKAQYSPAEAAWMKYVFSNYGTTAMDELGQITGFRVTKMPSHITPLTKQVLDIVNTSKQGAVWFEAYGCVKRTV